MAKKSNVRARGSDRDQKKTKRKSSGAKAQRADAGPGQSKNETAGAADAFLRFIESPLVADLLAVGATAALAAIAEHRLSRKEERAPTKKALKQAATAAAGAMGRRLASEFEEIQKAAKEAKRP